MIIIIIAVVAVVGYMIFKHCENVGGQMEAYENREPEWNPPAPKPQFPADLNNLPNKSPCCCANCKYLYSGTKTEYSFNHNTLRGETETTRYHNWCLVHKANVETEVGYQLTEVHRCGMFAKK